MRGSSKGLENMIGMCGCEMTSESNTRPKSRQEGCEGGYSRHLRLSTWITRSWFPALPPAAPETAAAGPDSHRIIKGRREPLS